MTLQLVVTWFNFYLIFPILLGYRHFIFILIVVMRYGYGHVTVYHSLTNPKCFQR